MGIVKKKIMTKQSNVKKPDYWDRLIQLRGSLSQEKFSKKIGVSLRAYQRYESGERVPHPHVLSKIAALCNTTVDWILTGDLNIEKAIILERAKKSIYMEDLIEKLEQITERMLKLKLTEVGINATNEEQEIIRKIFEDEKNFLFLVKEWTKEAMEEAKNIRHFDQISQRSPLYSIFRQIESMFNKGEKAKIEAIKAVLTALESEKDEVKVIGAFKVLVAVFESKF